MRVRVKVTAKDIELGRDTPVNNHTCPVARALKRAFPEEEVVCRYTHARIAGEIKYFPQSVLDFQKGLFGDFRFAKNIKPFSFTLLNLKKERTNAKPARVRPSRVR